MVPERVAYDRVVLTTGRASGIFGGLANRPIVVRFWWFLQFWKALEKVDEECHTFRALATSLNNGNSTPKVEFQFKFSYFLSILPILTPASKTVQNVEKMSNISELEKIFLLTLVQNAKCYRITRQENPEFLGEFDGGAKTTSNSGVISFEYREIWERYARYVSSLTNKQTKWMKCQVMGNQIKEEKIRNLH